MALYDGLPLNTPTLIVPYSGADWECWATRTLDGGNVEFRPVVGTAEYNRRQLLGSLAAALARVRQIQNQATTFAAQPPYALVDLAAINDLLSKTQALASATKDLAADIIGLARIVSGQLDSTT